MALPTMMEDLLKRDAYPYPTDEIKLIQTHISFVILTDIFVYKIKKPVNFGFLDFTTPEKRRFYCRQELDLNRRLSPDIYLEVLEIRKKEGRYRYDMDGEVTDYAVKMRRLPDDRMMINLVKAGRIDGILLDNIAKFIADFHLRAETDDTISSYGSPALLRKNISENFEQTKKYIGITISGSDYHVIKDFSADFISNNEKLLSKRAAEGKIRDCHGDMHMDHVYITDKVHIIDCIEFNHRFRYSDVTADIAFLAMDLDFYGEKTLSRSLINSYIKYSGDTEIKMLICFYKCYLAYVRGKVNSFELDDPNLSPEMMEDVKKRSEKYFKLALEYARS